MLKMLQTRKKYMAKKAMEKAEIANRLRKAGELRLHKCDAARYAGIDRTYFSRNAWCKSAYEEGRSSRATRFASADLYATDRLMKRQAYLAKIYGVDHEVTDEEFKIMEVRHRINVDEQNLNDREDRAKLRWQQHKLDVARLEKESEKEDIIDYIPTARMMTDEELSAYAAEDYDPEA